MTKFIIILLSLICLCGCTLKDTRQVWFRMIPSDVETSEQKYTKMFSLSKQECFSKILSSLEGMDAYIVYKNLKKGFIVGSEFKKVFQHCINTSEVGILIKDNFDGTVTVEAASGNYKLGKFVADEVFGRL